jgi:hypothetical protein
LPNATPKSAAHPPQRNTKAADTIR